MKCKYLAISNMHWNPSGVTATTPCLQTVTQECGTPEYGFQATPGSAIPS